MKISVIGAGNMGSALLYGMLKKGFAKSENVKVSDVSAKKLLEISERMNLFVTSDNQEAVKDADLIIIAVKPADAPKLLEQLLINDEQIIISIVAGCKISVIERAIGAKKIARVMSNTPALIGKGISAVSFNHFIEEKDKELVLSLLGTVGNTVELPEDKLDAVTGLSGSGPAYILMVIEALADGGVKMGLSREIALKLAIETTAGTAELLLATKEHPAVLKDKVASPGGTTIAGIHSLEKAGIRAAFITAVEEATKKSEQLGIDKKN